MVGCSSIEYSEAPNLESYIWQTKSIKSMVNNMPTIINIAFRPEVFKTALKVSLLVGTILALINHSPAIFSLSITKQNLLQIILTYLVPYGVSTYSAVKVIIRNEQLNS
jgi:hypothetical protein